MEGVRLNIIKTDGSSPFLVNELLWKGTFHPYAPNDVENAAELIEFPLVLLTATVKSLCVVGLH